MVNNIFQIYKYYLMQKERNLDSLTHTFKHLFRPTSHETFLHTILL